MYSESNAAFSNVQDLVSKILTGETPLFRFFAVKQLFSRSEASLICSMLNVELTGDRNREKAILLRGFMYEYGPEVNIDRAKAYYAMIENNSLARHRLTQIQNGSANTEWTIETFWEMALMLGGHICVGKLYQEIGNFEKAMEIFRIPLGHGLTYAAYLLGQMYELGQGVPVDLLRAFEYYERAIEFDSAKLSLVSLFIKGNQVQEFPRALRLCKAVLQSDTASNYQKSNANGFMGTIYRDLEQYDKALACFNASYQFNKNSASLVILGSLYRAGLIEGYTREDAKNLFRRAIALDNSTEANLQLAVTLREEGNFQDAIHYFNEAMKANRIEAFLDRGVMYEFGEGEPDGAPNLEAAVHTYQRAMDLGSWQAMLLIGYLYYHNFKKISEAIGLFNKVYYAGIEDGFNKLIEMEADATLTKEQQLEVRICLLSIYLKENRLVEAKAIFEKDPDLKSHLNQLTGVALSKLFLSYFEDEAKEAIATDIFNANPNAIHPILCAHIRKQLIGVHFDENTINRLIEFVFTNRPEHSLVEITREVDGHPTVYIPMEEWMVAFMEFVETNASNVDIIARCQFLLFKLHMSTDKSAAHQLYAEKLLDSPHVSADDCFELGSWLSYVRCGEESEDKIYYLEQVCWFFHQYQLKAKTDDYQACLIQQIREVNDCTRQDSSEAMIGLGSPVQNNEKNRQLVVRFFSHKTPAEFFCKERAKHPASASTDCKNHIPR